MGLGLPGEPGELQDFLMVPGIIVQSQVEIPGLNAPDLLKMLQIAKVISTRDPGVVPLHLIGVWLQMINSIGTGQGP